MGEDFDNDGESVPTSGRSPVGHSNRGMISRRVGWGMRVWSRPRGTSVSDSDEVEVETQT